MPVIALSVVVALAGVAGSVLIDRQRRLVAQTLTDPLTGAFNRRHLDFCLAAAIARRERTGETASILMFDVDYFKRINDDLGHLAGDAVLKSLVGLVRRRARKLDVLFRIGGEEFILLLPGATLSGALRFADTLRAIVAESQIVPGRHMSVSVGASELHYGQSALSWIADADAGMYRAKRSGRNRVSSSGRPAPVRCVSVANR